MGRILPIFVLLLFASPLSAQSSGPLEVLQGHIDQIIDILKDPQYQDGVQNQEQMKKMWGVINQAFDFGEIAKRSLSRNWRRFTPRQRKEFSNLFSEFLGNVYLGRIQGNYKDEKVLYNSQNFLTDSKAQVKTTILRAGMEIPALYNMHKDDGAWRIYDVKIEGVSLVKNYRSQFRQVLQKKSPDQLIELIKKKIAKQKEKRMGSKK